MRDPARGPVSITLGPGETFMRELTFRVRADAQPGQYFCEGAAGYFPNAVCRQGFLWTKVPTSLPRADGRFLSPPEHATGPEAIVYEGFDVAIASADADLDGAPAGLVGYPNPFSRSTTLAYTLAERSDVSLKVYDVTGRLVATLANGSQDAGTHRVLFDAGMLASGTYLCRLQVGDEIRTHRILVVH